MIKNLIVFFSISGALVLIYNIMNRGLGKRWDELGLVLFVIILFLTIIKEE
jgi:drug/metabolite transporter (DMT)-like permease